MNLSGSRFKLGPQMAYNGLTGVCQFLLLFLVFAALFPSLSEAAPSCASIFEDSIIAKRLADLERRGLPNYDYAADPGIRYEFPNTVYPRSAWNIDQIQTNDGHRFFSFDVGMKRIADDQASYLAVYKSHLLNQGTYSRPIHFDDTGEAKVAKAELQKWRWGFHDAVMRTYENTPHKKKYIDPLERNALAAYNSRNENSDVFGIVYAPGQSFESLSRNQINQLTAVTAQLTYPSQDITFLSQVNTGPFLRQIRGEAEPQKYLPFMNGMRTPLIQMEMNPPVKLSEPAAGPFEVPQTPQRDLTEFFKKLNEEFSGLNIAEINRLAKPQKDIPDSILSAILLKVFERAEEMKIDILFATADRATRVLFKRDYGFTDYLNFTRPIYNISSHEIVGETDEVEYVLLIRVGSPEYLAMKERLRRSVQNLTISPQQAAP